MFVCSVYPPEGVLKFWRVCAKLGILNMNNALILPQETPDPPSATHGNPRATALIDFGQAISGWLKTPRPTIPFWGRPAGILYLVL